MNQMIHIIDETNKDKNQVFIDKIELPTFHRQHILQLGIADKNMKNKYLAKVPIHLNQLKIFSQLNEKM
jgi:hypothetical protein